MHDSTCYSSTMHGRHQASCALSSWSTSLCSGQNGNCQMQVLLFGFWLQRTTPPGKHICWNHKHEDNVKNYTESYGSTNWWVGTPVLQWRRLLMEPWSQPFVLMTSKRDDIIYVFDYGIKLWRSVQLLLSAETLTRRLQHGAWPWQVTWHVDVAVLVAAVSRVHRSLIGHSSYGGRLSSPLCARYWCVSSRTLIRRFAVNKRNKQKALERSCFLISP